MKSTLTDRTREATESVDGVTKATVTTDVMNDEQRAELRKTVRGDKAEPFGGYGASWLGCFVGGELLVQAVTEGPEGEMLYGNFPEHSRYPERS